MVTMICDECGLVWPDNRFNVPVRGRTCFKCHVAGTSLAFTHGRLLFHGTTIREGEAEIVRDNKRAGVNAVPAYHRTYAGPATLRHETAASTTSAV
jgi:hypothetical protein